MLHSIISSSNDYDVVLTDNGNVVSCIGNFSYDIVCMGEHHIHVADKHKVAKTYHKVN